MGDILNCLVILNLVFFIPQTLICGDFPDDVKAEQVNEVMSGARMLYRKGLYDRAVNLLENLLLEYPKYENGRNLLNMIRSKEGELNVALESTPENAELFNAHKALAENYLSEGLLIHSWTSLQNALALNSEDKEVSRLLGRLARALSKQISRRRSYAPESFPVKTDLSPEMNALKAIKNLRYSTHEGKSEHGEKLQEISGFIRRLIKAREFEKAKSVLQDLLSKDEYSDNVQLIGLLSDVAGAQERIRQKTATAEGKNQFDLGLSLMRDGDIDAAEKALNGIKLNGVNDALKRKILRFLQKDIPTRRAKLHIRAGRTELDRVSTLLAEGKLDEAEAIGNSISKEHPSLSKDYNRVLAKIRIKRADLTEKARVAKITADRLRNFDVAEDEPSNKGEGTEKEVFTKEAVAALEQERITAEKWRIAHLQRRKDIDEAKSQMAHAKSLLAGGQPEQALGLLNKLKARELGLKGFEVLLSKADLEVNQRTENIRRYEDKVKASPTDQNARFSLGYLYLAYGRTSDSISQYEALLKLNPKHSSGLINSGIAYERAGNLAQAEQAYQRAVEAAPENPKGYTHLAYVLAQKKDISDARKSANMAFELAPDVPAVLDALGYVLHLSGNDTDARKYLSKAYRKSKDQEIGFHLAQVLAKLGEHKFARRILSRLITSGGAFGAKAESLLKSLDQK